MKIRSIVLAAALGVTGPVLAAAPAEATPVCAGGQVQVLSVETTPNAVCVPYPFVVNCEYLSTGLGVYYNIDLMACVPFV